MIKQKDHLVGTGLFLVIILLMNINGLIINNFLHSFSNIFKNLFFVVIGLLIVKLVLNLKKLKKNIIIALSINLFLVVYAFFLGFINGGTELIDYKSYLFIFLSFLFTLSIFFSINENDHFLINRTKNNFSLKPSISLNYKLFGVFLFFQHYLHI